MGYFPSYSNLLQDPRRQYPGSVQWSYFNGGQFSQPYTWRGPVYYNGLSHPVTWAGPGRITGLSYPGAWYGTTNLSNLSYNSSWQGSRYKNNPFNNAYAWDGPQHGNPFTDRGRMHKTRYPKIGDYHPTEIPAEYRRPLTPQEQQQLDQYGKLLEEAKQNILAQHQGKELPRGTELPAAAVKELDAIQQFLFESERGKIMIRHPWAAKNWLTERNANYNLHHYSQMSPERQYAVQLMGKELRGPGIFDGIIGMFVDNKKDGLDSIKWDGVGGAAVGFMAGSFMSSQVGDWLEEKFGFVGKALSWVLKVSTALGGALGGNMIAQWFKDRKQTPSPEVPEAAEPAATSSVSPSAPDVQSAALLFQQKTEPKAERPAAISELGIMTNANAALPVNKQKTPLAQPQILT